MTFAAAYTALLALAAELGHGTVTLSVEAWRYRHDPDGPPAIGWSVWCADRGRHYYARTAEDVLAAYRDDAPCAGIAPGLTTPEALDAIGAPGDACPALDVLDQAGLR